MFHLVSLSLQISLTDLPGSCLGLCVCVACLVVFVGLVVGFFFWGNLISITGSFQLLTDHVSHLSGNAGKRKKNPIGQGQVLVLLVLGGLFAFGFALSLTFHFDTLSNNDNSSTVQ